MISRFKPSVWIVAISDSVAVCRSLQFSYGVAPTLVDSVPDDWREFANGWLREQDLGGNIALLVASASASHPDANHRIEFIRVGKARSL
jgi:pyruvate kinase